MTRDLPAPRPVRELAGVTPELFAAEVLHGYQPVVMRGLVAGWPAIAAGRQGAQAMADYLLRFDRGAPADVMMGAPSIAGRFFYNHDLSGFNFQRAKVTLPVFLAELVRQADLTDPAALYAGAASVTDKFPGWTAANPLPLPLPDAIPRIWVGNASRVSTHYDMSGNVAAVVAGRRRFALFPPEQLANLYVGPLDVTIAGQPVSMVDLEQPDLERYPRFADAYAAMQVADLQPGDAIFIPALWWHDVKATGALNVLVNYWWGGEAHASPLPALIHALLTVRDLPPGERAAMKAWFDHFVFEEEAPRAGRHLPGSAQGPLGPAAPDRDGAIRQYLMRTLDRAGRAVG